MSNEIRKDYILDKWVIIATERLKRPVDFKTESQEINKQVVCPFCPGNEHMTPPAKKLYVLSGNKILIDHDKEGQKRRKDWLIRVIPNMYPALKPGNYNSTIMDNELKLPGIGEHEIIIETPEHNKQIHQMSDKEVELVFSVYRDRFSELIKKKFVRYVSIFRNHGHSAGASLSHPHSQIIATPIIPPIIKEEVSRLNYSNGVCKYDYIIEQEKRSERFVYENDSIVAFCPFASTSPFEVWIFVKQHKNNLSKLTNKELKDLAIATREILAAMFKLFSHLSYNYALWQTISEEKYHLNLRIFPRISVRGGFEYNTDIIINPISPENAAKHLRDALTDK